MKRVLVIFGLLLLLMSLVVPVFAHGGEEEPVPEPTTQGAIIPDPSTNTTNVVDVTVDDKATSTTQNVDSRFVTIAVSTLVSLVVVGITWFVLKDTLPSLALVIGVFIVYSAAIHLATGMNGELILIANGLGYLAFYVLRAIPAVRQSRFFNWLDWSIVAYTVVTIGGYFLLHDHIELVGMSTKLAEVWIIALLVYRIFNMTPAQTSLNVQTS